MDADQKKKCVEVLEFFFKMDDTEPFRERVNWEEWGLYDYLQVVKTPMDLGTIKTKLNAGEYKRAAEFARDMRLVWDNCKLYNQDGSDIYFLADDLSKKFEEKMKALKLDAGPRVDRSIHAPSVDAKIHFSQNVYKLSGKDLGAVIAILEEKCPKALDKSSPDELDIVIDTIDNRTFRDLEKMINEKIPEASKDLIARSSKRKRSRNDSKK